MTVKRQNLVARVKKLEARGAAWDAQWISKSLMNEAKKLTQQITRIKKVAGKAAKANEDSPAFENVRKRYGELAATFDGVLLGVVALENAIDKAK